ncbi:atp-dependent RNA helicase [Anaeramoeba flamelloides]|uniref:Atp-dependent RNA helicase n=1 Tax=Anaeramoeba flamelloides TaxID=1746091 RepID=A0AAV8A6J0_9EUKA|nr:atp-dependent RNA helicase [Anaeramoeba flamelloides]
MLSPSPCLVGITQPRRITAIVLSDRVAGEINSGVGEFVGYSILFDDRTSKKKRVKFMTDENEKERERVTEMETKMIREMESEIEMKKKKEKEKEKVMEMKQHMAKKLLKRRPRSLPLSTRPMEASGLWSKRGLAKQKARDSKEGIDGLEVVEISKESARQRMGRAGRENTAKCFRIYTKDCYHSMKETRIPEIQRTEMADVLLKLIALGIPNIFSIGFDRMPPHACPRFNKIHRAGMPFRYFNRCVPAICPVDFFHPFPNCKREKVNEIKSYFASEFGDHITYLNVFETWAREGRSKKWCTKRFIN